jgi:hypothetical protein
MFLVYHTIFQYLFQPHVSLGALASNMTAELQTNVPFLLRQIDLEG